MSENVTDPNPTDVNQGGTGDAAPTDSTLLGKPGDGEQAVDLATLFTEEEVTAKKEAIAAAKAEEERRAALSDEERAAEDAKKAEEDAKKGGAPEQYEPWKLADGVELDKELAEKFTPLAKELNLSQANAQAMIDFYSKEILPEIEKQAQGKWESIREEWGKQAIADKVFGGDKHEEMMQAAGRVMDAFEKEHPEYGKNLRNEMNEYGYGNSPNMVAFVKWMGKRMGEDPNLPGKSSAGQEKSPYLKYKT